MLIKNTKISNTKYLFFILLLVYLIFIIYFKFKKNA